MGMFIDCDNKGCRKTTEALLDKVTDDVYCTECGKVIESVTIFAKAALRSMSQYKTTMKSTEAFAVECTGCKKMARPRKQKDSLFCPHCSKEHTTLSPTYAYAIKQFLSTNPVSSL